MIGTSAMTVSRKGKRSITVGARAFLWWVQEDDTPLYVESSGTTLHVVPAEGGNGFHFHLGQPDDRRYLIVHAGRWRRYRCPAFGLRTSITPSDVAALIGWVMTPGALVTEVNYLGLPIKAVDAGL